MLTYEQIEKAFVYNEPIEYPEDCAKIRKIIHEHCGYTLSLNQAQEFWRWRSDQWDAGWLFLNESKEDIIEWFEHFVESHTREE